MRINVVDFGRTLYLDYLGEQEKNTKEQLTPLDPRWKTRVSDNTNESERAGITPIKDITLSEYLWQKKKVFASDFCIKLGHVDFWIFRRNRRIG